MQKIIQLIIGLASVSMTVVSSIATAAPQAGTEYKLVRKDADTVTIFKSGTGSVELDMRFSIFFATQAPELSLRNASIKGVKYTVPTWFNKALKKSDSSIKQVDDFLSVGDGFDPSIQKGSKANRTADLFKSAANVTLSATQSLKTATGFKFSFPKHPMFTLETEISLPDTGEPPVLSYRFTPKKSGYYSVGYVGAPSHKIADVEDIWQPLIWQEKRFPNTSFMTLAFRCPIPTALLTHKGVTLGMVVDPDEFPFDELPVLKNSRFGVALRNRNGLAQPMTFAPALGSVGSKMPANQTFEFKLRPVLVEGNTVDAYAHIATSLYGFRDYRSNAIGSLNQTLENMADYGMSKWSRFHIDEKGCSYATDAPGAVKNVSSLNPLELAIIMDDEEIFDKRAYPVIEYMLSRGKFLFTTNRQQKIQSPSYTLSGPCAPISELATLYNVFGGGTTALVDLAKKEYQGSRIRNLEASQKGQTWPNAMALYKMTGQQTYLDSAMRGADRYIEKRITTAQTNFDDPFGESMFFWTQYNPRFIWLLELYELTGKPRYLKAAQKGARRLTQQVWMSPKIPEKNITVNPSGKAPLYYYLKGKGHKQMRASKESVPAWRLSTIGLTCESSGTSAGHRGIFMANHAPWLIRIGALSDDDYLQAVGRSAIVGRYMNFPGYHVNTARTTVYEKPDYPLRPHKELSVNSMHYNHIWPMMSMVLDYLVSETVARSDSAIDFPSQFIEGYAYMQNKFYGAQKGRFYDANDAILWMPKKLLKIDSPEVNYIAARGENSLYLALLNESDVAITTKVALNDKLVPRSSYPTRIRQGNEPFKSAGTTDGTMTVTIPARGLTAVVLDNCRITPRFQKKLMGVGAKDAWAKGLIELKEPQGRAMILNLGRATKKVFIYLTDDATTFNEVRLTYDMGQGKVTKIDKNFPWEFTLPLDASVNRLSFSLSGLKKEGQFQSSKTYQLSKD
ncbi:MAG: hypothetical protein AB8F34_05495 [Akkermansiaceae bacterium]